MSAILSALLVEMTLITYRGGISGANKNNPIPHLPVPADYAGAVIIFGALSLLPGRASRPAGIFAWGLVLATGINLFTETNIPGISFISPSNPSAQPTPITTTTQGA